ncbi:MAG: hypothetical protein OEZ39_06635 [Gammaproteobacteria bacterium]|nr:hypothetical protein [Gammaproteobacteria bacterium]MDH5651532.1 hypothetical protein [Gammaproteobacteria bacterium]
MRRIKKLLARFAGKAVTNGDRPWDKGPAIYTHITLHIDPETGMLREEGSELPDAAGLDSEKGLRWAPGALDGVFGHHQSGEGDHDHAATIAGLVKAIAEESDKDALSELYQALQQDEIISSIDAVIDEIIKLEVPIEPELNKQMVFLARRAADRGPVKFAIALLGLMGKPENLEIIKTLGLHEEFTLYSAVAITNLLDDPEIELLDLAQRVDGWGRIHIVERLVETNKKKIKDWIFNEGFRNSIMDEYLVYIAATTGELNKRLKVNFVDDETLNSAIDILEGLFAGGPAEDIYSYEEAAEAITSLLRHIRARVSHPLLGFLLIGDSILTYLNSLDPDTMQEYGWSEQLVDEAGHACHEIIAWPSWEALINTGLESDEPVTFYKANRAAGVKQIDTWDIHWRRVEAKPDDSSRWFQLVQLAVPENISKIIELAEAQLPLQKIAGGAANEIGLGPEYKWHICLDFVLQGLENCPGEGWELIKTGLHSPVTRNRHIAVKALEDWDSRHFTGDIIAVIKTVSECEVDEDVREKLEALLRKVE